MAAAQVAGVAMPWGGGSTHVAVSCHMPGCAAAGRYAVVQEGRDVAWQTAMLLTCDGEEGGEECVRGVSGGRLLRCRKRRRQHGFGSGGGSGCYLHCRRRCRCR